jgi:hypothetical protein
MLGRMKDLLKPGRPLNEYLKKDGTLKIHCFTCIHRIHIGDATWGNWLCRGGNKWHRICNPRSKEENIFDYKIWEPRVDVNNSFIKEEEFIT